MAPKRALELLRVIRTELAVPMWHDLQGRFVVLVKKFTNLFIIIILYYEYSGT